MFNTRTADEITLIYTIRKCTCLERRPSGKSWRLEYLLWTGVSQPGGTFTNGILLSAPDSGWCSLVFMGKDSIHWDNCSFLTHFTIISGSACQCFLVYSPSSVTVTILSLHFYHPERKPWIHQQSLPPSSPPAHRSYEITSVSTDLPILTFRVNGVTVYVSFCVWVLLLGVMASKFLHFVASVHTSFF